MHVHFHLSVVLSTTAGVIVQLVVDLLLIEKL